MDTGMHAGEGSGWSRTDETFREIKSRLLMGDFPAHARLGEERLAALLGVSRTPVREALQRLAAEGLVVRHVEGGWCPAAPDVASMQELYEVRMSLELAALRRPESSGRPHDPGMVETLRDDWRFIAGCEPRPDPGFVLIDESFHIRLAEAAGNAALADMLRQVNERIRLVRMHDFLTEERVTRTVTQHLGIAEAVLAGDLNTAQVRFALHLGESMAVVAERVTAALARMASTVRPAALA